jgi:hypothetical protein
MKAEESGKNYCGSYVGNMQGFLASRSCDSCLETTTRRGDRRSLKSDVVIKREQLLICAADLILKRYVPLYSPNSTLTKIVTLLANN